MNTFLMFKEWKGLISKRTRDQGDNFAPFFLFVYYETFLLHHFANFREFFFSPFGLICLCLRSR